MGAFAKLTVMFLHHELIVTGVRKEEGSSADVSVNASSVMETPDFLRKRLDGKTVPVVSDKDTD